MDYGNMEQEMFRMYNVNRRKGNSQCSPSKNYYHISFASECQLCFETCNKPRRLPCEHEFCKNCLSDYFERNIPQEDPNTFFPCPSCNKSIDKPSLPRSKWTKEFKLDKRTLFYTGGRMATEDINTQAASMVVSGTTRNERVIHRRATTPNHKPTRAPQKRSGVHFPGIHDDCQSFKTKISTDKRECVYWGGAILSTGHIILPDYYNSCVKIFTIHGNYVCHAKTGPNGKKSQTTKNNWIRFEMKPSFVMPRRPFDVTEIDNSTIVVSHGAHENCVTLLSYNRTELTYLVSIDIDGYLYSLTRRGKRGIGIMETIEGTIKLARIANGGHLDIRDPGELSVFLSTGSHVQYYEKDNVYFFTEKRNLLCADAAFNILFVKSYPYLQSDHYMLGSVTLDSEGTIFVTSDSCLLRIDKNGNKSHGSIPTMDPMDPFYIMSTSDGTKIILVGRNNRVSIYIPPQL